MKKHPEIIAAEKLIESGMLTPRQIEQVRALLYEIMKGSDKKLADLDLIKFSK